VSNINDLKANEISDLTVSIANDLEKQYLTAPMKKKERKEFLNSKVKQYNRKSFIDNDPICIPHSFSNKQDIEIIGFWTATLAWGQRKTIINKSNELVALMGNKPYDFILNHNAKDRKRFANFKHRTFQTPDTYYFLEFFQWYYRNHESLEDAFFGETSDVKTGIDNFRNLFFSLVAEKIRTEKHIASAARGSTCKRINMFLRWMVRKDTQGVDFGIWNKASMADLMIPLDVHVSRVAKQIGLLKRKQNDWKAVEELTANLRKMDPEDPVKYDYALFSIGVLEQ